MVPAVADLYLFFAYIWAVSEIRLLFLGDIVGKPGRELVRRGLPSLIEHYSVDLVIANAENAAAGRGITREIGDQLLNWGVDVMTSGNHIWSQREAVDYIGAEARLLRPANFPAGVPGNGSYLARTAQGRPVGVINVMGRVFMQELDNPFHRVLEEIELLRSRTRIIFVDFHAEATSEKIAMGWHLDGKATAIIGTHTHVQTADERIIVPEVLRRYKGQETVERRYSAIKGPLAVAPLFLKNNRRIAALITVICLALLIFCLVERQVRHAIAPDTHLDGLGSGHRRARPTGRLILTALASLRLIPAGHGRPATIPQPDRLQTRLLDLLDVDPTRPP